jgi:hypothetical protein
MENLINKNINLQNKALTEIEAWIYMLKTAQLILLKAYNKKDFELAETINKEIDFIQKQVIRLSSEQR